MGSLFQGTELRWFSGSDVSAAFLNHFEARSECILCIDSTARMKL